MVRRLFPNAVAAAVLIAMPGPSVGESLADAFIAAYRNSALLEASRALLRAEDESVASAVAALRPTLSTAASITGRLARSPTQMGAIRTTDGNVSTALSLTAELLVSDGGAGRLGTSVARETVLATRQTLLEVEQAVLMSAATAFHDVMLRGELLELAENGLLVFETQLEAAKGRFELGEITKTDVSLVEARLASARSQVLLRRGELEIARESYRLATGVYPGDLLPPPPAPEVPNSLDRAQSIARQLHPSIVRAQHTVAAAQLAVKQLEVRLVPQVYLGGTVATNREFGAWERGTDSASVSLTARMPLYQGGAYDSAKRRGIANLERARFELEQAARRVDQEVASAWTRLQIAESSIEARELQVAATELALMGIKQEAGLGLRTTLDVIDSEQDVLAAVNDLIAAKNDRNVAVYGLLVSVGLMTVKHLGLGIPVYDPNENLSRISSAPAETWPATTVERAFRSLGMK